MKKISEIIKNKNTKLGIFLLVEFGLFLALGFFSCNLAFNKLGRLVADEQNEYLIKINYLANQSEQVTSQLDSHLNEIFSSKRSYLKSDQIKQINFDADKLMGLEIELDKITADYRNDLSLQLYPGRSQYVESLANSLPYWGAVMEKLALQARWVAFSGKYTTAQAEQLREALASANWNNEKFKKMTNK